MNKIYKEPLLQGLFVKTKSLLAKCEKSPKCKCTILNSTLLKLEEIIMYHHLTHTQGLIEEDLKSIAKEIGDGNNINAKEGWQWLSFIEAIKGILKAM